MDVNLVVNCWIMKNQVHEIADLLLTTRVRLHFKLGLVVPSTVSARPGLNLSSLGAMGLKPSILIGT